MGPEEATQMADYIGARVNIPIHGNGKEYWKQRRVFSAKGTKRLFWGQTIFLRRSKSCSIICMLSDMGKF